jgi:hypothetical protein
LSCDIEQLAKLLKLSQRFQKIVIDVSIDATQQIAEFVRHGLEFSKFTENLTYLFDNVPGNVDISLQSLMTSLTVQDLANFTQLVETWKKHFPRLFWRMAYCDRPVLQGFKTLKDSDRQRAIKNVQYIKTLDYVIGASSIESALNNTEFSNTLYKQMQYFVEEFAQRKNINIPYA